MKDCTLEQKITNAQARVLEFDNQIDGPSKTRFAKASIIDKNEVLKEIALKARNYLIVKRGEMVKFLLKNDAQIPTRGI